VEGQEDGLVEREQAGLTKIEHRARKESNYIDR
jgi:hypothetical protein